MILCTNKNLQDRLFFLIAPPVLVFAVPEIVEPRFGIAYVLENKVENDVDKQ